MSRRAVVKREAESAERRAIDADVFRCAWALLPLVPCLLAQAYPPEERNAHAQHTPHSTLARRSPACGVRRLPPCPALLGVINMSCLGAQLTTPQVLCAGRLWPAAYPGRAGVARAGHHAVARMAAFRGARARAAHPAVQETSSLALSTASLRAVLLLSAQCSSLCHAHPVV